LNINNAQALGTAAGTFTIGGAGNNVSFDNTSAAAITTLNYPMNWNDDFTFTGTQNLNMGTGAVTMSNHRQLTVNANNLTIGGIITGNTFGLTKTGNGTLTLSGSNTFTGGTTLNAGKLNINNNQALGTVAGTFTINGGTIDATANGISTIAYPIALNADVFFTGTNSLHLGTGAVTMNANRQINVTANTLTIGGDLTQGNLNLTKTGSGILSFAGNNVSLNTVTLSSGTLTAPNNSGSFNLNGDFTNNGTFNHNSGTVNFT
jgi:autotransporter-associated beta strand protein